MATKSNRIVGLNFNMDAPNSKAVWKDAFGTSVPWDSVYSGRRALTPTEIQSLFDVSIQPVEQHLNSTKAPLNTQQRMAVLSHMVEPGPATHGRGSFPYGAESASGFERGLGPKLSLGDPYGVVHDLLYTHVVAPAIHTAEKAAGAAVEAGKAKVETFVKNLPFGIGGGADTPKSAPAGVGGPVAADPAVAVRSFTRATSFVSEAAAASAIPSFKDYTIGHVQFASTPLKDAIIGAAHELGVDPVDLGTVMSYETAGTFSPNKRGPTTQWGTHYGLIQWGTPQREKYGIGDKNGIYPEISVDTQMQAVVQYLKDAGVTPGMNRFNLEAAINAGDAHKLYATDQANGGAPGTVMDKVRNQMAGHEKLARTLLGDMVPAEFKLADVVTGAGRSEDNKSSAPPSNSYSYSGSGNYSNVGEAASLNAFTAQHSYSGSGNYSNVGEGGVSPFSTYTYGPGATSYNAPGMMASVVTGAGLGNMGSSHSSPSSGGAGYESHVTASTPSTSYSGSGNYSNVGEGGGGTSGGQHSTPSTHYSGSGNYSNVGEGGSPPHNTNYSGGYDSGGVAGTTASGGDY